MPRSRSISPPAANGSSAPKGRKTTTQGKALGSRQPKNPSPEGAEQKSGWRTLTLGELGHWYGGGTPSKARADFWTDGDIPWVSPKDMKTPKIQDAQDHITKAAVKGSSTSLVPPGSVLVVVRSGILKHTLLLSHLLKNKLRMDHKLVLNIAERGNSTKNANLERALAKATERHAKKHDLGEIACKVVFNVQNHHTEPLLNVADYLCWAVQRVFERGETRYYDFLSEKISLVVDLYDSPSYPGNRHYTPAKTRLPQPKN